MEGFGVNITQLADLLKPSDESESEDEEVRGTSKLRPSDIGPPKSANADQETSESQTAKKSTVNSKDIWQPEEVTSGSEFDNIYDSRPQPQYDIVYQQAVTPEDMFLQMGNKTTATSSCENMIVNITLPDAVMADVQLDVKDTFLDCRTPSHHLGLHLPYPVDSKNAKAQWDKQRHLLSVTLKLNRFYDFVNF